MTAGLEGDHQGASTSRISGLLESSDLSVGFSSTCMKSFANQLTLGIKNNGTNQRIGTGVPLR